MLNFNYENSLIKNDVEAFLSEWNNDLDYVVGHTSGSTGEPKQVRLYKSEMIASALATNKYFGINNNSVLLLCLSVDYIAGKMQIVRTLVADATLICEKASSRPISKLLSLKIDFAALVPMQVENEIDNLSNIETIIIGGAPISTKLFDNLQGLNTKCYSTYGMTETVSHVALKAINVKSDDSSEYYEALENVYFEKDDRGCLIINANYLNAKRIVTNDIVKLLDNQHFKWMGRYDNVINSGGIKFFPEEIEKKISPFITNEFYITGKKNEILGNEIVLVIQDNQWSEKEQDILFLNIKSVLTKYSLPKSILFVPEFTRTKTGKIKRKI